MTFSSEIIKILEQLLFKSCVNEIALVIALMIGWNISVRFSVYYFDKDMSTFNNKETRT